MQRAQHIAKNLNSITDLRDIALKDSIPILAVNYYTGYTKISKAV
ncbi:hypothetical protein APHWI1_0081 [Anaplasma phagocytophilum str. ApWI1]|uniref:Uncharacterized protein n=2 Tax=Anaplasma phagocytophilum TaxID=948 RepID=Q2GKA9_ANAPZ|nr:hypothetical protein APH_0602 [Anaplasma phagocytophilum str. HZ]KJV60800.1 hypothetical protein APHWEB_1430 [Anaplasma phagocytophilum str. Webster]KJV82371.1 hypothetical protein APHHGE2_0879 [Anaplasma phagocytophilum str. HGE2]KJV84653.1 hypothetical protein APHWI1_0081 [Anaplasma phagocytophilum str. ApWI1]KJV87609.1 hypothetical protein APHNYW_0609 [Anaplasma phagocytophilum str. ApNYW]KJV98950.1 hypothetical protein OTSANNIE_0849 [Anaplasma phagocytophilum str. Annie]KJZ98145.1 hypo